MRRETRPGGASSKEERKASRSLPCMPSRGCVGTVPPVLLVDEHGELRLKPHALLALATSTPMLKNSLVQHLAGRTQRHRRLALDPARRDCVERAEQHEREAAGGEARVVLCDRNRHEHSADAAQMRL